MFSHMQNPPCLFIASIYKHISDVTLSASAFRALSLTQMQHECSLPAKSKPSQCNRSRIYKKRASDSTEPQGCLSHNLFCCIYYIKIRENGIKRQLVFHKMVEIRTAHYQSSAVCLSSITLKGLAEELLFIMCVWCSAAGSGEDV